MPDLYMPDVKVEIAFNAGYTTPAASRVWTDVSPWAELAEGLDITVGRTDEQTTAGANTLTLTLDNSDGRFTAGRSGSPYFPNVKVGRPIRVTSTPVGGTASTRFVGFVDEWPVEWEGSDAYAKAKVRATSRLSRLGLTASLRSGIEQEFLSSSPVGYWTLAEPSGSMIAADSAGGSAGPLAVLGTSGPPIVFGSATGPAFDDLTAATFAGGEYLYGGSVSPSTAVTVEAFFSCASVPASGSVIVQLPGITGYLSGLALAVNNTNKLVAVAMQSPTSAPIVSTVSNITDGATHHAAVTYDGTTVALYLDGSLIGSATGTFTALKPTPVSVGSGGYPASTPPVTSTNVAPFTGVIAHVAVSGSILSAGTIAAHASVGATGYAGDRTDQRVTRLLGWVGVAASEVTVQTGAETMTYQKTDGQSVVDALRECESTEGGVLFDGRDGNVTFQNRSNRYLKTATATLNMATQHVERDYSPKLDRSTLTNDVTVSNPTTEQTARSTDTASQTEYGIATSSATSVASTYEAMQQKAAWTVASYAEPRSRVPSLTVDVLAHQGLTPSTQTLLGVNVGDLLAVTNAPTQAATTSPSYFVEGYTERIGPQSYEITYNLSPTYPALSTFVLDDTTRGVLDAGYVLAL